MTRMFDLDRYCERIGYAGPRTATLETLAAIHLRHAQTIPFENLNPLLKSPVGLDLETLEQKLVRGRRGGYCYEHNLLLKHVLEVLGFRVTGLAARVLWNAPAGVVTARNHMLLLVDLAEGRHIADVGFGGLTLTGPLRLEADIEQTTPHEPFRLTRAGDMYVLEARTRDTWQPLYRFDLQEQFPIDYEISSWYLTNHPNSFFVTNLIAARPDRDRRYALRNNELAVHHLNGESDRRIIENAADLLDTLEMCFHVTVPDTQELRAVLERVIARRA
jgi:N-hydroxyarylamine O-acetyltransferase